MNFVLGLLANAHVVSPVLNYAGQVLKTGKILIAWGFSDIALLNTDRQCSWRNEGTSCWRLRTADIGNCPNHRRIVCRSFVQHCPSWNGAFDPAILPSTMMQNWADGLMIWRKGFGN